MTRLRSHFYFFQKRPKYSVPMISYLQQNNRDKSDIVTRAHRYNSRLHRRQPAARTSCPARSEAALTQEVLRQR